MQTKLTQSQKSVLSKLLDKYEKSKSYTGENQVNQNFYVMPTDIYKEYQSDFADVDIVRQFEDEIYDLVKMELIDIKMSQSKMIDKIFAVSGKWQQMYQLLGRIEKNVIRDSQINYYGSVESQYAVINDFCMEQVKRLTSGKNASYELEEAKLLIHLCEVILSNKQDILERELSISVFGDSKIFEKKYRTKVCNILRSYGDFEEILENIDEKREAEHILLEEFHIFSNPTYVYFKGNATISFRDGKEWTIRDTESIALSANTIEQVDTIQIKDSQIMTIENLTSFNRMSKTGCFYIFLSGYHNSSKNSFLKLLAARNNGKNWLHFGDIDPDGFYIYEHLKKATGIEFELYLMGIEQLEKYASYTKELEKNDLVKAANMISMGKNREVLEYMLNRNCKLEQEIISWKLSNES